MAGETSNTHLCKLIATVLRDNFYPTNNDAKASNPYRSASAAPFEEESLDGHK